jgi:DNA-binding CsgD family transcriptional regulator
MRGGPEVDGSRNRGVRSVSQRMEGGETSAATALTRSSEDTAEYADMRFAVQVYVARAQRDITRGVSSVDDLRQRAAEVAVAFSAAIAQSERRASGGPTWTGDVLTNRERQVLHMIAKELSTADIADTLKVTHNTVNKHLTNARSKLGVRNTFAAVLQAWKLGLISPD